MIVFSYFTEQKTESQFFTTIINYRQEKNEFLTKTLHILNKMIVSTLLDLCK
ncbi:hypothetical protein HMPREF0083_01635 [Aneurinibacillus aneurinilyticus ATCC 12856]|uniref:Uncharacterized protein n=1 Tax=Aneurinibacillus aneurinilyticus ATCC 12856 TaxID=649747 RepID=U1WNY1_ANEAE|nr:hypothetical protein HMPREF0083_01635 [Aneurinibacillus aneurinilyticus ATCC 12856]